MYDLFVCVDWVSVVVSAFLALSTLSPISLVSFLAVTGDTPFLDADVTGPMRAREVAWLRGRRVRRQSTVSPALAAAMQGVDRARRSKSPGTTCFEAHPCHVRAMYAFTIHFPSSMQEHVHCKDKWCWESVYTSVLPWSPSPLRFPPCASLLLAPAVA